MMETHHEERLEERVAELFVLGVAEDGETSRPFDIVFKMSVIRHSRTLPSSG